MGKTFTRTKEAGANGTEIIPVLIPRQYIGEPCITEN